MKRYEGLLILDTAGREEGIKETIDGISDDINMLGGRVETVQKMDKRHFTRIADKKATSGFFVNVIFECVPAQLEPLRRKITGNKDVFRVLFTIAPAGVPASPAAVPAS